MSLSVQQQAALHEAKQLLRHVGLSLGNTDSSVLVDNSQDDLITCSNSSLTHLPLAQRLSHDPSIHIFTEAEILQRKNQVNRQSYLDALCDHPLGSIVEYPDTGDTADMSVGHMFSVDSTHFHHPKLNIQHSLGDYHGMQQHVKCKLLRDLTTDAEVLCKNEKIACMSPPTYLFSTT
jgi:hypothetical protein